MKIQITDLGKRYRYEWIFRNINYTFNSNKKYAILGANGSGKSTFLKILSGHLSPSHGQIEFSFNNSPVPLDNVYPHIAYAAPYIELIEEFNLIESLEFHSKFKKWKNGLTSEQVLEIMQLEKARQKVVKYFSSGMKQRLKLAMAICSDCAILLLDEPSTNLDRQGIEWYQKLIAEYADGRILIIASNVEEDYKSCDTQINIVDYKKKPEKRKSLD